MNDYLEKVIVFGEILFDVYGDDEKLGGAPFNVAYNLHMLGHDPVFISKIGEDRLGKSINSFLSKTGMNSAFIRTDKKYPTGKVRVTLKAGEPDYEILQDQAYDYIEGDLPSSEAGLIYYGTLAARSEKSKETLLRLITDSDAVKFYDVNLRKNCWDLETVSLLASHADHIKMNENELIELTEDICVYEGNIAARARVLLEMYGVKSIYVTFGSKGAALVTTDEHIESESFFVENMKDTVGAGDAFSSVIISGLLEGADRHKTLSMAAYYASKICTIQGALTEDEIFYKNIKEEMNALR